MFFQKIILFSCIFSLSLTTFGCSKNKENNEADTVIEITTEEALLATALDQFNAKDLRGTATTYITTYEDGTTKSETENILYNISDSVIEKSYTSDNITQKSLYVKDGDDIYCYESDDSYPEGWVRYLDNPDEIGETSYDAALAESEYSFNEASGYTDVTITNEGKETLNGINTIKLSVTATLNVSAENSEDETAYDNDSITRKDIIAEFGWSEESINAVDGFSEILDRYVAYLNKEEIKSINNEDPVEEYIFWIDEESSCILQMQSSFSTENTSTDLTSDIESEFWDNSWKVDWIQSDIDDGLTVDEAKEILELEGEFMEAQMEYENSLDLSDEDVSESGSYAKEVTYTKLFLIGDDCPSMTDIPSAFTETTYEDYYNAFEE